MAMVSSTEGSLTITAGSAARVPGPSRCACGTRPAGRTHAAKLRRSEGGLSMFAASPRPFGRAGADGVCRSSMKQFNPRFASVISRRTAFSPVLELAAVLPSPRPWRRVDGEEALLGASGTSPATMRWASPSTIAVLPNPAHR